jgi:amino acid transporter
VITGMTAINLRGIKESAGFNVACTLIEVGGLFLVVAIGAAFLFDGGGDVGRAFEFKPGGDTPALLIIVGASIAFYALIGFEDAVNVAEETKDSTRTFPRTRFAGLGIAGGIYLLVTLIAGMSVPAGRLAGSDGPLGAATCAGLSVQQIVDDPKLVLWAGGLLLFGLILWGIERAVR